ncbi:Hypothetical Protein OBI_RACECAR_279 [Arthrobacter phage Racecar]|nr:hypothetical protein PBI_RACECAR_71 [Arthrobacter phage Racecar]
MNFAEHPAVKYAKELATEFNSLKRDALRLSSDPEVANMLINMEYLVGQQKKLIKLLRNDSEKLMTVTFEGCEEWLDFTMSDAVLLKIRELNAILKKKIAKTRRMY